MWDTSTWQPPGTWQTRRAAAVDNGGGTCPTQLFRGGGTFSPYLSVQIARGQAKQAGDIISGHSDVPNQQSLIGSARAIQAYTTTILGEAYCEMRLDPEGAILTPQQTLEEAVAVAEAAVAAATSGNNNEALNFARVVHARALARLGRLQEAKASAEMVPEGFSWNATYASNPARRSNMVAAYNRVNLFTTVPPAYRNLTVEGEPDTRVSAIETSESPNDGVTDIWFQGLYTSVSSPIPLATWQEAQLIIAQAEAAADNPVGAVQAINRVRDHYDLPNYASSDIQAIRDQVIEERRRTLWIQSHRLGDMLQFNVEFPQGLDHRGRSYTADATCLHLPAREI